MLVLKTQILYCICQALRDANDGLNLYLIGMRIGPFAQTLHASCLDGISNSSINETGLPGVNKFCLGATSACCVHGMHLGLIVSGPFLGYRRSFKLCCYLTKFFQKLFQASNVCRKCNSDKTL